MTNHTHTQILIFFLVLVLPLGLWAQQIADTTYKPTLHHPAYESGKGSVVFIDEGHHNFHTKDGRYQTAAKLLERDGYQVKAYKGLFEKHKLAQGKILIISNALHESNLQDWFLPNPSAFTQEEIEVVRQWVFEGGSLFLIADHMPMGGAAEDLARAFGFEFTNGFAMNQQRGVPDYFNLKHQTLTSSIITMGRDTTERVEQIVTFTGQAFKIPEDAIPILTFDDHYVNLLPDTAWVFNEHTTRYNLAGWSQLAYKTYGKGRIVASGEAAMFTAQVAGPEQRKFGMNSPYASENYQLLLNIIHWLDGILR